MPGAGSCISNHFIHKEFTVAILNIVGKAYDLRPGQLLMLGAPSPDGTGFELKPAGAEADAMGIYVGNSLIAGDGIVTIVGQLVFKQDLPTSDPGLRGQVWVDAGVLKVSGY